jgi:beta-lactam-binding protein with PASTA domain/tRNA A-37 threonylcarbamoyl transferase component Bud32
MAMDDTLADPLTGRLLDGRYAVNARIAHGGMATVYLAMDTRLDRQVALKVMHAELARDEEFVRRFIGEAKSVARLNHQNVVAVFDQGADGPFLYLAMEYVPGRTLKDLLRERGRFTPAAALDIMAGVLDGLAAAHMSGIVHRDVKPENVLLTADGRLKVADFGLARAQAATGHTRAGLLIGTVAYLPPEQVTGDATGPRSDVYSAGVVLFELLTGRQPFTADTPIAVAYQHVNTDVPAPSALVPGIPAAVDQLVLAATSRDPARRPADAGEFARAVRRVRESIGEPSGHTGVTGAGVMGAGVQGLHEAPWLNLDTPAATNGWWAPGTGPAAAAGPSGTGEWWGHDDTAPPQNGPATGPYDPSWSAVGAGAGADGFGPDRPAAGSSAAGSAAAWSPGLPGQDGVGSRTMVVHREEGRRFAGGREPFLQRWLFSPRLAVVALIAALGIGLGLGGWWLASGRYASIPVVANDSVTQATAALTTDGFKVAKVSPVHNNSIQKGTVVGTTPSGRAAKGTAVTILVSSGPFTSIVPKVSGDKLPAAQAALTQVHLSYTIDRVGSGQPVGTVLGTKPGPGTSWPQTKPVAIEVAEGLPVPDFIGQSADAAQQWSNAHGAGFKEHQDQNSSDQPGTVTGQEPAAGSVYQQGETIVVNVAAGPQEVMIPDVIGMSVQAAEQALRAVGFNPQIEFRILGGNRVWNYSPVGTAPRGSVILLDIMPGSGGGGGGQGGGGNPGF